MADLVRYAGLPATFVASVANIPRPLAALILVATVVVSLIPQESAHRLALWRMLLQSPYGYRRDDAPVAQLTPTASPPSADPEVVTRIGDGRTFRLRPGRRMHTHIPHESAIPAGAWLMAGVALVIAARRTRPLPQARRRPHEAAFTRRTR